MKKTNISSSLAVGLAAARGCGRTLLDLQVKLMEAKIVHGDERFEKAAELAEQSDKDIFYYLELSDEELGIEPPKGLISSTPDTETA